MEKITKFNNVQNDIITEITQAIINLGGTSGLVANIQSWGDTLPDADVLANLKDWNGKKYGIPKNQPQHQ